MTGNKCLLDTSIIVHTFRNNIDITKQLLTFSEIFIPSIAVGELYYGAYRSGNVKKHLDQLHQFLKNYAVLNTNTSTADLYGSIKTALKNKGKPIPENDIWIAAIAVQFKLPLFTTDKHFEEIDHIVLI